MIKHYFTLWLKSSDTENIYTVERFIDEDTWVNKFVIYPDNVRTEFICDSLDDFFTQLAESLKGRYQIHSCYTCRYGNLCPEGGKDVDMYCVKDVQLKCKEDLISVLKNTEDLEKRKVRVYELCNDYKPCSDDYWRYK